MKQSDFNLLVKELSGIAAELNADISFEADGSVMIYWLGVMTITVFPRDIPKVVAVIRQFKEFDAKPI